MQCKTLQNRLVFRWRHITLLTVNIQCITSPPDQTYSFIYRYNTQSNCLTFTYILLSGSRHVAKSVSDKLSMYFVWTVIPSSTSLLILSKTAMKEAWRYVRIFQHKKSIMGKTFQFWIFWFVTTSSVRCYRWFPASCWSFHSYCIAWNWISLSVKAMISAENRSYSIASF